MEPQRTSSGAGDTFHERGERRVPTCLDEVHDREHENLALPELEHVANLYRRRDMGDPRSSPVRL